MPKWLKTLLDIIKSLFLLPKPTPTPEPEPVPEPTPTPTPTLDMIDLTQVTWGEQVNPSKWKITANITAASFTRDGVTANYTGTTTWPVRPDGGPKPSIGNWWVIAKVNGVWHGSTIEWLGPGKTRVTGKKWDGTDDIHGSLGNWRPTSGEQIAIMLSTVARGAPYTIEERSQAFLVTIP